MYRVIPLEELKKSKQYRWFRTFSNPDYGFNVKMDVTDVLDYSHKTKTSFFINLLFIITKTLNNIEEFRLREVNDEIRLYDIINPTFTVMTKSGLFENVGLKMNNDYKEFYKACHEIIEEVKTHETVKETYNDSALYDDYYMTCVPWVNYESMTHPLIDNDYSSLSVPRICWGKYVLNDKGKYELTLNITVSHCFVDGYPLSKAFNDIQEALNNAYKILK